MVDLKRAEDGRLVKTSSKECRKEHAIFPQCILNPCVTERPKNRMRLSYAYTGTPVSPNIKILLDAWQSQPTFAPDFVVIQLELNSVIVDKLDVLLKAVPALCDSTVFLLLTQTEVAKEAKFTEKALLQHEDDVRQSVEASGRACLRYVPVSGGTYDGMRHHALHHEAGSNWHFMDPGRYYLAQAVLNAMQQAIKSH